MTAYTMLNYFIIELTNNKEVNVEEQLDNVVDLNYVLERLVEIKEESKWEKNMIRYVENELNQAVSDIQNRIEDDYDINLLAGKLEAYAFMLAKLRGLQNLN